MELNAWRMADVNDRLRPTDPIPDNNWGQEFSSRHTRIWRTFDSDKAANRGRTASMDRRAFIRMSATASVAGAGIAPFVGPASAAEEAPKASSAAKDVTKSLANYIVKARFEDLPDRVRKEAGRS